MNFSKLTTGLCILALALAPAACTKPSADEHPNPKPGTGEVPEPVETDISSIHDLNTGEGYLNSHSAEWQNSSVEMDYRSYTILRPQTPLAAINARYPRIKKLKDGSYMLSYQQGATAHSVYYARSNNFYIWTAGSEGLFPSCPQKQYDGRTDDTALHSSSDAIVLANGDILSFVSFRCKNGYRTDNRNNGIKMRRSTDNGKSWSTPEIIYRGTTWEPSAVQLASGEIHVYFTSADPNKGDSGTALLRSTDNGATWTHIGKVIREHAGTATDGSGDPIYTDQMPVPIQLNGSDEIAVAFEARFGRSGGSSDQYHLGMAYTNDNWAAGGLTGTDEGPADKQKNLFLNQAAPYLRQFRSGETLLSCNISQRFNVRLGDAKARTFGEPVQLYAERGVMGSVEIIDDHTFAGVFPAVFTQNIDGKDTDCANLMLAKFVLNHRINATQFTPSVIGSSNAWKEVQDALFIGSVSQAQAAFRFAYDDEKLYCLVERLDGNVTAQDGVELMIQSGNATGNPLVLKFTVDAEAGTLVCDNKAVASAATILGSVDNEDNDEGYVLEIAIPRTEINAVQDRILFNAVLHDDAGDDTFTGLTSTNYEKWLPVELKLPAPPVEEPEPGDDDNGRGPQWDNGEETNPWK